MLLVESEQFFQVITSMLKKQITKNSLIVTLFSFVSN